MYEYVSMFSVINVEELLGKTVIGSAGNYIGEVNNIDIDSRSWQITHLRIKLSDKAAKEFGVKKTLKSSSIKLPTTLVSDIDVIIRLNWSLGDLKNSLSQKETTIGNILTLDSVVASN
jgi:sporulation protein YlmC with PRC-barrel domain